MRKLWKNEGKKGRDAARKAEQERDAKILAAAKKVGARPLVEGQRAVLEMPEFVALRSRIDAAVYAGAGDVPWEIDCSELNASGVLLAPLPSFVRSGDLTMDDLMALVLGAMTIAGRDVLQKPCGCENCRAKRERAEREGVSAAAFSGAKWPGKVVD